MRNKLLLFFILGFSYSCTEEEKIKDNSPPVAQFTVQDDLDKFRLDASLSTDADHDPLIYSWSASTDKVAIKTIDITSSYFKIPDASQEETVNITLKVRDRSQESVLTQSVNVPALTEVRSFGLGRDLVRETSNNRPYEWYSDQGFTGTFSTVNCGPAVATMAIAWSIQDFPGTPQDARNTYRSGGGWWYTDDIINYLNKYNVNNWTIPLDEMQSLKDEIDKGNIAILCLDMFHVAALNPEMDSEYRKNKFYATAAAGWGHFVVVKGYKEVDGIIYFEVYDSYSFGNQYTDLTPKGKNRYYTANDLDHATQVWWDFAIVVSKNAFSGGRRAVNNNEIEHKPGQ